MDRRQFLTRAGIASVAAAAPVVAASQSMDHQAQIEHHIAELRRLLAAGAPSSDVVCVIRPDDWDAQSRTRGYMDSSTGGWI